MRQQYIQETDPEKQTALVEAMHRRLWEVVPYVPLGQLKQPFLWRKNISGCSRRIRSSSGTSKKIERLPAAANLEGKINQWLASTTGTAQIIATNLAVSQIQGAGGAGYPNAAYAIVTVWWKPS